MIDATCSQAGNGLKRLDGNEFSGYRDKCLVPHMMQGGKAPRDGWELDPLSNLQKLQLQGNRVSNLDDVQSLSALPCLRHIQLQVRGAGNEERNPMCDHPAYRSALRRMLPQLQQNRVGIPPSCHFIPSSRSSSPTYSARTRTSSRSSSRATS